MYGLPAFASESVLVKYGYQVVMARCPTQGRRLPTAALGMSGWTFHPPPFFFPVIWCFLFSPFPPLVASTNLFLLTSLLSHYLPLWLAPASPCVTDWLFQSLSLRQVIVRTRSWCVSDSHGGVKPDCCGASSYCCLPGFVKKRAILVLHLCPAKWNWQLMRTITEVDKQKPRKASRMAESLSCLWNRFSTHCTFALLPCCLPNIVSILGTAAVIHAGTRRPWRRPWHCPRSVGLFLPAFFWKAGWRFSMVSSHMDSPFVCTFLGSSPAAVGSP